MRARQRRWLRLIVVLGLLLTTLLPAMPATAQIETDGWSGLVERCGSDGGVALQTFSSGPGTPVYGTGSLRFSVATVNEGRVWSQFVQTEVVEGISLATLQELRYWTFLVRGNALAPHLILDVDLTDDGVADDRLIYQPERNGTVTPLTWQEWEATNGVWWSERGLGGIPPSAPGSLATYLRAFPGARLAPRESGQGGLAIGVGCVGSGWAGWEGAVDALLFRASTLTVLWDFEATGVVTTRGGGVLAGPEFSNLQPSPWATIQPGAVTIGFTAQSSSGIRDVRVWLNDDELPVNLGGSEQERTVQAQRTLGEGRYTVRATASDRLGRAFTTQWQFVVSTNSRDSWWFTADGKPRREEIERTLRSLSEAFRWHLYGISWDGSFHPEMPTHANPASTLRFTMRSPQHFLTLPTGQPVTIALAVESTAAPLSALEVTLNGQPLPMEIGGADERHWSAFTERMLAPGTYGVTATARDTSGQTLTMTWGFVVSSNPQESPWFNADGTMKASAVERTLRTLVEVFRWHLQGVSWDGQLHPEVPTHATQFVGPAPLREWFDSRGNPNPTAISEELRALEEVFRWHFWGISWDGQRHPDVPTHAR